MTGQPQRLATSDDLRRILGELDDPEVIEILELAPTVADLKEAMTCLAGDDDVLAGEEHPVSVAARRIVEIMTAAAEEDEHLRALTAKPSPRRRLPQAMSCSGHRWR
ncbi:MAG: hypothetical protein K2X72_19100 [Reyranella sp.]|nr:hypothetical protein [Reyranella sp.]